MKVLITFGGLGWSLGEHQFRIHQSRAMTAIFANLILNHDVVRTRDAIAETIWPEIEKEKSRSNLNTAMWRLRKDLKSRDLADFISLETDKEFINLKLGHDVSTDFERLSLLVENCERLKMGGFKPDPDLLIDLQDAIALYRADFVPGLDYDWASLARETFRMRYLQACNILMTAFEENGQHEMAVLYGQKILEQDDLRENTHRRLIAIYVANGLRHQAIRQYQSLSTLLKRELGLAPSKETTALISSL